MKPAMDKLAEILARHYWTPGTIELPRYATALKGNLLKDFFKNVRFIESGKKIKSVDDAFEPTLEKDCESVQIADYYDESVLLVDRELWDQLNWTNKMALLAHESMYFLARQRGTKNSMGTRKLVGMLFSEKSVRPLADGVPTDRYKSLDCRIETNGFSRGNFYLYTSQLEKKKGLEAVFFNLANDGSLFRTSAFFKNLSIVHLEAPGFNGSDSAILMKDTYPARDQIQIHFLGIADGNIKAELRLLQGTDSTADVHFDVACRVPNDFSKLEGELATEPGNFQSKDSGDSEVVRVKSNGAIQVTHTFQVGGPGGISGLGVAPYPTVCRYTESGVVISQTDSEIEYWVISGALGDLTGLKETEHCKDYIEAFNREAKKGELWYTLRKENYTKIP